MMLRLSFPVSPKHLKQAKMSVVNTTSMMPADAQKAILAIEKQLSVLRAFAGMPTEAPLKKGRGAGKKSKAASVTSDGEPKKKRELTPQIQAMNEERKAIFEELKSNWATENPDFASLDAAALKTAVTNGEVSAKPRFSDALKEHSRRSREGDPEKQAKYEAYRAKVDAEQASKKSGASSVASEEVADAPSGEVKKTRKNPWEGLTEEQRAERVAKMKAGKAAKKDASAEPVAVAAPAPVAVAPVAEKRPVKAAPAKPSVPKPSAPKPTPVPVEEKVEVVAGDADDEETYKPFEFKGAKYFKNGLQYVYKMNSDGGFGDYAGRYDVPKRKIDATVPEPPVED
jgi:hypothetical protein